MRDLYLILSTVGRPPTDEEIRQFGIYDSGDFLAQFGSLRAAVERVEEGLSGEAYRRDDLAEHLKTLDERLGRPPLAADVLRSGAVPLRKYGAYFDSWESALTHADLSSNPYTTTSRAALAAAYEDLWDRLGRPPLPEEVTDHTPHSRLSFVRRFGNWGGLLNATDRPSAIPDAVADDPIKLQLALDLRRVSDRTGGDPGIRAVNTQGRYDVETYQTEFDTWEAALEAAGLAPSADVAESNDVSPADVRRAFETVAETDPVPTFAAVLDADAIDPYALFDTFGSWKLTTTIAGVPYRRPRTPDRHLFPSDAGALLFEDRLRIDEGLGGDAILRDDLDRVADETEGIPRPLEVELLGAFSPQAYLSRYGSWEAVVARSASDADDWSALRPTRRDDVFGSLLHDLERSAVRTGRTPTETVVDTRTDRTATSYVAAFGDFETAVDCAGVRADEPVAYARDVMAAELYRLAREFGTRPPDDVLPRLLPYDTDVIVDAFGSMRKAWTAARNAGPKRVSKAYGSENVAEYRAALLSETPDPSELSGDLAPSHLARQTSFSPETYRSVFGTLDGVAAAIGDESTSPSETADDDDRAAAEPTTPELCSALWDVAAEAGTPVEVAPSAYDATGRVPISTVEDRCGDFATAAETAGLETERRTDIPVSWYPPLGLDLVDEFERVRDVVGGRPTVDEMNAHGRTSVGSYVRRFGSWESARDAVAASGESGTSVAEDAAAAERRSTRSDDEYSRAELLDAVESLGDDIDGLPTTDDMNRRGSVSLAHIYDRFGSWESALREAGLLPSEPSIDLQTPVEAFADDIHGLGPRGVTELETAGYETVEDVRHASKPELTDVPVIGPVVAENLLTYTR